MRSSFGTFGMLKMQLLWGQHFEPELLGRREIALPSAGANTNELIAKHADTREFVLVYTFIM